MPILMQKKCPTCGGRLELISSNKYECRCCHNVYEMNEGNTSLYDSLQTASTFRESLNFKQAEMLYKNMLKKYTDEDLSDVYWNLLLCEQRVMFETDQNGEQFPSFYDIAQTEIDESEYYSKAIEYAQEYDSNKLMCFVDLANKMQEAKNKYRTIKNTTKPYDIFICFKKSSLTDPNKLTKDYQLAYDLYNHLSASYKVFFSERSLDNIVIREYEPNIYHALYTAKIMLVLCSDIDYLNSQWVKNEWSRFKMMTRTSAQAKSIIPIFIDGFAPEQLPDELRSCQGYNNDIYLMQKLGSAIKAIINPVDKEAEIAAKLKAEMQEQMEALKRQLTEQNKTTPQSTQPQIPQITPTVPQTAPLTQTNYIVPYGTTEIEDFQFKNRTDLTSIVIPSSVTKIGKYAFYGCSGLTSITIPDSVTCIEYWAFWGCSELTAVHITNLSKWNEILFSGYFSNPLYYAHKLYLNGEMVTDLIIPNDVTHIRSYAFNGCNGLTSATIPNNVTSIDSYAFYNCSGLTNVIIPDSVTHIGAGAFSECSKLTSVKIPNNVTSIDSSAFSGCSELNDITIHNNVTTILWDAFNGCSELKTINFSGTEKQWKQIKKKQGWNKGTGKYIVHCTDGDVKKSLF